MPIIKKIGISELRNISSIELYPGKKINLLYGDNGSGKTSILEAIYLLGLARSFRSNSQKPLIKHDQKECTLFAERDDGVTLGLNKVHRGSQQTKISGQKVRNTAELARCLPIQLLNSDTFKILEGSPKVRRHFLDWGVFHVEHRFLDNWRQLQRALKNRNSLVKKGANKAEVDPWTSEFVKFAIEVDLYRQAYLEKLLPTLMDVLEKLLPLENLALEYDRGWDKDEKLSELLNQSYSRDVKYGYTVFGPQRADLRIKIGEFYAVDVLSRGQQKLLVSALKIAQGCILENESSEACIYLLDDLPSELDKPNRMKVCKTLEELNCQVFITMVEQNAFEGCWLNKAAGGNERKLFHVKHGSISHVEEMS